VSVVGPPSSGGSGSSGLPVALIKLRVMCIKLALEGDRVGRSEETIVNRAKAFEEFIMRKEK
jgi:hypothetical protein